MTKLRNIMKDVTRDIIQEVPCFYNHVYASDEKQLPSEKIDHAEIAFERIVEMALAYLADLPDAEIVQVAKDAKENFVPAKTTATRAVVKDRDGRQNLWFSGVRKRMDRETREEYGTNSEPCDQREARDPTVHPSMEDRFKESREDRVRKRDEFRNKARGERQKALDERERVRDERRDERRKVKEA